jgi:hypothetical protein
MPGSTAGRSFPCSGSPRPFSLDVGMAVANIGAVVAGTELISREPMLDIDTGLVWRFSPVVDPAWSDCICRAFCAVAAGASVMAVFARLVWLPRRVDITAVAGFGLVCLPSLSAFCSLKRRSSSSAAAPVKGRGEKRGERALCGLGDAEARRAAAVAAAAMGASEFDCDEGAREFEVSGATDVVNGPLCVGVKARVVAAMKKFQVGKGGRMQNTQRDGLVRGLLA